jgi:hypothetical protein
MKQICFGSLTDLSTHPVPSINPLLKGMRLKLRGWIPLPDEHERGLYHNLPRFLPVQLVEALSGVDEKHPFSENLLFFQPPQCITHRT